MSKNLSKFFLIVLTLSPILLIFFLGYPLNSAKTAGYGESARCFKIGDLGGYLLCSDQRLNGINLFSTIIYRLNHTFSFFGTLFIICLLAIIFLTTYLNLRKEDSD